MGMGFSPHIHGLWRSFRHLESVLHGGIVFYQVIWGVFFKAVFRDEVVFKVLVPGFEDSEIFFIAAAGVLEPLEGI